MNKPIAPYAALMKRGVIGLIAILLLGCSQQKAKMSDAEFQKFRAANPGMTKRCLSEVRYGGVVAWRPNDPDCFEMMPDQRWSGLWNRGFEWTNFCPEPAKVCPIESDHGDAWLEFAKDAYGGPELADGVYRIEFIGRRTKIAGSFGHQGQYDHLIIADRVISVRKVSGKKEE